MAKEIMEKRTSRKRTPAAAVGKESGNRKKPKDRITAKVLAAEAAGYGCHYGQFVADYPDAFKDWEPGQPVPVPDPMPVRVCPVCGRKFASKNKHKVYCSDECKERRNSANYRAAHKNKEENENGNT